MKENAKCTNEPWEIPAKKNRVPVLPIACVILAVCVIFLASVCLHYVRVNHALAQENINLSKSMRESAQEDAPTFSEWSEKKRNEQDSEAESTEYADRPLFPVLIYSGDVVKEPGGECVAPLEIVTTGDAGYYISLKPTAPPFSNAMSFYVWGGNSEEILVPLGEYEIYYAVGETWCGIDNLFGEETSYYKCDGTFDFYEDGGYFQGWTLELFLQSNGNMDTDSINAEDFPA